MRTNLHLEVKTHSKKLRANATSNYWQLLSQLCNVHSYPARLSGLTNAVRQRDFDLALDAADLLSSQKYTTADAHFVGNQLANLVKKYILPSRFNPEERAMAGFIKSEQRCSRMNRMIALSQTRYETTGEESTFWRNARVSKARRFIRYVLGDEPPWNEIMGEVGFGPGAVLGVHGNATNAMRKLLVDKVTMTPGAGTLVACAVSQNLWLRRMFSSDPDGYVDGTSDFWRRAVWSRAEWVKHNKIAFVPKTAKIHRSIAVEPWGNALVQKGIGNVMALRLKRVGIDITDQERNQDWAFYGSVLDTPGGFVTLDLSAASDSVSSRLVELLLPPAWVSLLKGARSSHYTYNGQSGVYAKFCAMGNGFCFPLETLIFTAACHACGCGNPGRDFTVYGDDIIVKGCKASDVIKTLWWMGFTINPDKSFTSGPFRESCGADWFGGVDVRPLVLDYALDSVQNVFKFLNQTHSKPRWRDFFGGSRQFILRLLTKELRLFRPFEGDVESAITSVGDEHLTSPNCRALGHGLWRWTELQSSAREDEFYLSDYGNKEPPGFVQWYGAHTLKQGANAFLSDKQVERVLRDGFPPSRTWFTLRNVKRTRAVVRQSAGELSNWLPGPVD